MSNFSLLINQPPIYNAVNDQNSSNLNANWQKLFNQMTNQQNVTDGYGNPSVALNSDFYWNNGVSSPITTDTFISEKWKIFGAATTTFTVTQTAYNNSSNNQTGSTTYLNIAITGYTGIGDGSDLYIYQRQSGSQFLRRYQNRNISMSIESLNNNTAGVKVQMQMYIYYDTTNQLFSSSVTNIDTNTDSYSSIVFPSQLTTGLVGSSSYIDFRLAILPPVPFISPANNINFNLNYFKAEICDKSTDLYVDHALERVRIDNS